MKYLTPREANVALLAGKKVDYSWKNGDRGLSSLSWDEDKGIVDKNGYFTALNSELLLSIAPEPLVECWLNIYKDCIASHRSEEKAEAHAGNTLRTAVHMQEVREGQ